MLGCPSKVWREMFLAAAWVSVPLTFGRGGGSSSKDEDNLGLYEKRGRGKSRPNPQRTQPPRVDKSVARHFTSRVR